MMKTTTEIIQETADFYNSFNRAYDDFNCWYVMKDGRMCAVGRCLLHPKQFIQDEVGSIGEDVREEYLEQHLKLEYRGHSIDFWAALQNFHDENSNWDEVGMSPEGRDVYENLIETFGEYVNSI